MFGLNTTSERQVRLQSARKIVQFGARSFRFGDGYTLTMKAASVEHLEALRANVAELLPDAEVSERAPPSIKR